MTRGDGGGLRVVLDMQDRRPAWAMPPWVPERIRAALPEGSVLDVLDVLADGSGDGSARAHPAVLAAVADADAYLGYGIPAEVLRRGTRLRWVHSGAAGVGGSLTPEMRASEVVFTNSAGVHGPPMAETVLAMVLHFFRGLDFAVRARAERRWDKGPFYAGDTPVRELSRATVGVVGFGGVGREVGRRCAALGARVLGLVRTSPGGDRMSLSIVGGRPSAPPDVGPDSPYRDGVVMEGAAEILAGPDGLARLLAESDAVVACAPETDATRRMFGGDAFGRMKPGAVFVNVGRGGLVDEDALVEALGSGRLRGAGLDVFASEPLPPDHPFWTLPNVVLTPHVSAVTDAFWARETELIVENVRRLVAGVALRNVVDREAGY